MVKENDMILPHLTFSPEELDKRYPPLVASEAVDTEDLTKDNEDELILEGARIVKDLVSACALQGRRRHLADHQVPCSSGKAPGSLISSDAALGTT